MLNVKIQSGTVVKLAGLPFRLKSDTIFETNADNHKLVLSQSEHSLSNPIQAASLDRAATNSLSLDPICLDSELQS